MSSSPAAEYYARLRGEPTAEPPATPSVTAPATPALLPWTKDDDAAVDPVGRFTGPADYRRFQSNERDGGLRHVIEQRFPTRRPAQHIGSSGCHCMACTGARQTVAPRSKPLVTSNRVHHAGPEVPTYSYITGSPEDPGRQVLPPLPKPDAATLERLSQPPEPPKRTPAPGSRASVCVGAGHQVTYRATEHRWHCLTCDRNRHRKQRGTEPEPETRQRRSRFSLLNRR